MHKQLKVTALVAYLLLGGAAFAIAEDEDPYAEPSPTYLRQYRQEGAKTFVLERFDADGRLVARSAERLEGKVAIGGPVERTIGGQKIALRGLTACPTDCPSSNDLRLFGLWKIGVSGSDFGLI